jgi:DNA-binding MarR family transcriptional regulator
MDWRGALLRHSIAVGDRICYDSGIPGKTKHDEIVRRDQITMKANLESAELILRLWRRLYETYTVLKRCEDLIFEEHGLTTEQYAVLVSLSYVGQPARVTDIAQWLERSTNSISMIVDRMVKAGLVRRVRDKVDRRVVYVSKTSKAESMFRPASVESFALIRKILSPMPDKDKLTLLNLLGEVKYETLKCLDRDVDVEKIKRDELKQSASIRKWMSQYAALSTPEAGRQCGKKKKTAP